MSTSHLNLGDPTTTECATATITGSADEHVIPTVAVVWRDAETYEQFGFYPVHGVDELSVANPTDRSVHSWARDGPSY